MKTYLNTFLSSSIPFFAYYPHFVWPCQCSFYMRNDVIQNGSKRHSTSVALLKGSADYSILIFSPACCITTHYQVRAFDVFHWERRAAFSIEYPFWRSQWISQLLVYKVGGIENLIKLFHYRPSSLFDIPRRFATSIHKIGFHHPTNQPPSVYI